jgi:myo-inositol 2-dehydrogenase / D-chiro-inositol 1-dehydrogenase
MLKSKMSRRQLLGGAAAVAALAIVPRSVLGGAGRPAPSDRFGGALIGCGDRGNSTWGGVGGGVDRLAECDVKFVKQADNKSKYTDFRRVVERKDIDVVAIATPPHWHALITIAAMQNGKDVLCEKPMTRFVAEGRAVVEAERRYKRIFQIGIFYRYGTQNERGSIDSHKIMMSGVLGTGCKGVFIVEGGLKVRAWSGLVNVKPEPIPEWLDWDMYCGPSPLRPYHPHRYGGSHRGYWDYDGGGLGDMGQHALDAMNWRYGKDYTSPVEIETYAPPAHPECTGLWGWSKMTYADGFTVVLKSNEWGDPYSGPPSRGVSLDDLDADSRRKVQAMPDPVKFADFSQAIRTRQPCGAHAEASHRTASLMHLTNVSIRVGRKLKYDPVKEQVIGDEEANRLINQPMRAPWHL